MWLKKQFRERAQTMKKFKPQFFGPQFCCVGGLLIVAVLGLLVSPAAAVDRNEKNTALPATSSDASKYVGAETCKTCHEEIYNAWEKTPHWKTTLNKEGGPRSKAAKAATVPARTTWPAAATKPRFSSSRDTLGRRQALAA